MSIELLNFKMGQKNSEPLQYPCGLFCHPKLVKNLFADHPEMAANFIGLYV
jgi:uncharacterized protein YneF (UPF0154 family)